MVVFHLTVAPSADPTLQPPVLIQDLKGQEQELVALFGMRIPRHKLSVDVEVRLAEALPKPHSFLVEFLRTTYKQPEAISNRNSGIKIMNYVNDFIVDGIDCRNRQHVSGRNESALPVRGIAFALVGGSSVAVENLGAKYRFDERGWHVPEFLKDDDRFKIAYCAFNAPLMPQEEFELEYTDNWRGAMRIEDDGFFFPESLYFPQGIERLSSRVDFTFPIKLAAVLQVDLATSKVQTSAGQPVVVNSAPGMSHSILWETTSPPPGVVFVLYYQAAR